MHRLWLLKEFIAISTILMCISLSLSSTNSAQIRVEGLGILTPQEIRCCSSPARILSKGIIYANILHDISNLKGFVLRTTCCTAKREWQQHSSNDYTALIIAFLLLIWSRTFIIAENVAAPLILPCSSGFKVAALVAVRRNLPCPGAWHFFEPAWLQGFPVLCGLPGCSLFLLQPLFFNIGLQV